MDLNKATLPELQTLMGIGEKRAAAIMEKRGELTTTLTREALASLEVGVSHSVIDNLIATGAILDVPFEKQGEHDPADKTRGECGAQPESIPSSQLERLLVSIQSSITGLAMSSQQVDERMTQMEERFAEREASMLALWTHKKGSTCNRMWYSNSHQMP